MRPGDARSNLERGISGSIRDNPGCCGADPFRPSASLASRFRVYTAFVTRTLDTAIAKLTTLPAEEQDRIAQWLLDELRDEDQWMRQFANSQDALSKLAAEARTDRAQGRATELDPDKL